MIDNGLRGKGDETRDLIEAKDALERAIGLASVRKENAMKTAAPNSPIGKYLEDLQCEIPPPGWRCTRAVGHAGPCAAVPILPQNS